MSWGDTDYSGTRRGVQSLFFLGRGVCQRTIATSWGGRTIATSWGSTYDLGGTYDCNELGVNASHSPGVPLSEGVQRFDHSPGVPLSGGVQNVGPLPGGTTLRGCAKCWTTLRGSSILEVFTSNEFLVPTTH